MGIFDFLKARKKEPEIQSISFEELDNWRLKKSLELSKSHQVLVAGINEKISLLASDLIKNKEILEKLSLNDKKVDERIKLIVKENLDKYIINLRRLIESLESIDIEDYRMLMARLDNLFLEFDKRSSMHYEKATFLIGNELGKVKETISDFVFELRKLTRDNEDCIRQIDIMDSIKDKISSFLAAQQLLNSSKDNSTSLGKEIDFHNSEMKDTESIIAEIKESPEYKKEFEMKTTLEEMESKYEKTVLELKSTIDFKELSRVFHTDPKKMITINNYKDDFKEFLEKDNANSILFLLRESGTDQSKFLEKFEELEWVRKELKKEKEFVNTNLIHFKDITAMETEIRQHKLSVLSVEESISKEQKRIEKLNDNVREVHEELKRELEKMNITLSN